MAVVAVAEEAVAVRCSAPLPTAVAVADTVAAAAVEEVEAAAAAAVAVARQAQEATVPTAAVAMDVMEEAVDRYYLRRTSNPGTGSDRSDSRDSALGTMSRKQYQRSHPSLIAGS